MNGIWIIGAGELATGVAWRLLRSGYPVIMSEIKTPVAVRRLTCFSEAVYQGSWTVEGICARYLPSEAAEFISGGANVLVDPEQTQMERLSPAAIIDARMLKIPPPPPPVSAIPIIGLGPGFCAGLNATLVLETHRIARPGEVIRQGKALPDTGIPGSVGGETAKRLLRAPAPGFLVSRRRIGDLVVPGEIIADVGGCPLMTEIGGILRGLIHENVELTKGMKVGDVDPRGEAIDPQKISDKALNLGGGALEALLSLGILPA